MLLNFGIHIRGVYSELITISVLGAAIHFTASLSNILSAVMQQTVPKVTCEGIGQNLILGIVSGP